MDTKFALVALTTCFALSACGGGGSSTGSSTGGTTAALSSAEAQSVATTYTDYQNRIKDGSLTETSPTGKASMAGYLGIDNVSTDNPDLSALGKLAMDVDFDAGKLSGTASDFGVYTGTASEKTDINVTGSLDVTGTVSGSALSATATGTVSDGTTPSDLNLNMTGKFYDDSGTLTAVGTHTGTMKDQGASDSSAWNVDGGFYATKQ